MTVEKSECPICHKEAGFDNDSGQMMCDECGNIDQDDIRLSDKLTSMKMLVCAKAEYERRYDRECEDKQVMEELAYRLVRAWFGTPIGEFKDGGFYPKGMPGVRIEAFKDDDRGIRAIWTCPNCKTTLKIAGLMNKKRVDLDMRDYWCARVDTEIAHHVCKPKDRARDEDDLLENLDLNRPYSSGVVMVSIAQSLNRIAAKLEER